MNVVSCQKCGFIYKDFVYQNGWHHKCNDKCSVLTVGAGIAAIVLLSVAIIYCAIFFTDDCGRSNTDGTPVLVCYAAPTEGQEGL